MEIVISDGSPTWSDWAVPLFAALLGALIGGGLTILGGYLAQKRASQNAMSLLDRQRLAEHCADVAFAISDFDVKIHLQALETGASTGIPAEVRDRYRQNASRILLWVDDREGIYGAIQSAMLIVSGDFAVDNSDGLDLRRNLDYRAAGIEWFRGEFAKLLVTLPRDGEDAFIRSVSSLVSEAKVRLAHP